MRPVYGRQCACGAPAVWCCEFRRGTQGFCDVPLCNTCAKPPYPEADFVRVCPTHYEVHDRIIKRSDEKRATKQ